MNDEAIAGLLERLDTAVGAHRGVVAREILDHHSTVIRSLAVTWCAKFQSPDDVTCAWTVFGGFAVILFIFFGPMPVDPVPVSRMVTGAVLGLLALVAAVCYHRRGMARHRRRKRLAELAGEALTHGDRPRYALRLLGSLYGFRDKKQQQIVMVAPVADALTQALAESEIDVRRLTDRQRGCVRMHLSRVRDQMWREPLAQTLLAAIQRDGAVELLRDVRRLARAARSPEILTAAESCAESLAAALARQEEAARLLRPSEGSADPAETLLRPAAAGADNPAAELLLRVDTAE